MKIYSMTATFGKLEHETLTFQPGLNIIQAPNEWGKSTWCAFLVNMLYGIETRTKSTKTALADKERYAPWSGSPMSGRMELCWNGRDITIERSTRGRVIFGDFRAYETATGIDIPELNSVNCGQMLLGVERSVFTRAGFLKLSDLPVTQDDSLRRRLNNLVTTGDESGAGDKLGQKLKDLKNKCRFNRSGLLPQAENERDQLRQQLEDLHDLGAQSEAIRSRQALLDKQIKYLVNHQAALGYEASLNDALQVEKAVQEENALRAQCAQLEQICQPLPSREETEQNLHSAQVLQQRWMALQSEPLPETPQAPQIPDYFAGTAAAEADAAQYQALEHRRKKQNRLVSIFFVIAALAAIALAAARFGFSVENPLLYICGGGAIALIGILILILCVLRTGRFRKEMDALFDRHPGLSPDQWVSDAQKYAAQQEQYLQAQSRYQDACDALNSRRAALDGEIAALTGGSTLSESQTRWNEILAAWNARRDALQKLEQARQHTQALQAMLKPAAAPEFEDRLTFTAGETDTMLQEARFEQRQLQLQLGKCQGQMESLGQESLIKARLDTLNRRIARLEDTYYALEMAQDALRDATTALQRRFAPRISKRAQALFGKLTAGRYQRITLGEDLSLSASAENEDVLRSAQWRSDGTVDQLYFALRLAVAEELTPEAPLVLDDALVRFDDQRLAEALQILKEASETKQVILFTCQGREPKLAE